ncbi:MAG TPA: PAS domain S-box protein, partial [Bacteroidota bacterium]|nr:PAS domain S-box protein [Bacteroidota bacterium]
MKSIIRQIRRFFTTMGLVEQSQVVASTAVVVAMVTIVTAHFLTGHELQWLDFISVITVGIIGYVSVFFSLKYGRMLEEQRRELMELNAITEAVNHSVELNYVLQSALVRAMELMRADCGWIYLSDNGTLHLKHHFGTAAKFFPADIALTNEQLFWIREPGILNTNDQKIGDTISAACRDEQLKIIASIPLFRHGNFAGVLIIASKEDRKFKVKKIALIQAFGNQISSALNNASLFEQVKNSERLYADLYENSPDMYHSVDRNGIIVSCNVTESRHLGIPKENIIGRPLLSLYPTSQHDHVRAHLKKIFEEGKELKEIEGQVQRHDGSLIDVNLNTSLVYDGDGKAIIARMVLRDITERKKMEEKILQAQKIDSIGNLAGGIAHDFNNILTAILGSASIMRRKLKEDTRWLKYIDLIETTSRRGAAVTRQLLTFARKSNPHIRLVDMNSVIDQTIRLFEATTSRAIQIRTNLSPDPVIIEGDEGQ